MDNFLNNLYSYDNFGIYLIIAIVILVILFFLILFFGKKDKKNRELEETKRLQKLNPDLFKLDDEKDKVESIQENKIEEEEIKPIINEEESLVDNGPTIIDENISENNDVEEIKPILTKEEEKPLVIEEEPLITEEKKVEELPEIPAYNPSEIAKEVEEIKEENKEVEHIDDPEEKVEKITTPNVEVFSSVYVPKEEIPKVEEEKLVINNEDDEFELPALKTDEEEELISEPQKQKENNSFSSVDLDSIAGESYNINK